MKLVDIGTNGSEDRGGIALKCEGRNAGFAMERLKQGEKRCVKRIWDGGRTVEVICGVAYIHLRKVKVWVCSEGSVCGLEDNKNRAIV